MKSYRSLLFVPANDPKKVGKALESEADCIILDLEDSIAESEKEHARRHAAEAVASAGDHEVLVRINAITTPHCYQDLMIIAPAAPTGLLVPKAESPEDLRHIDWLLGQLEYQHQLTTGSISLAALVETAAGITAVNKLAHSCKRLGLIAFGAIDYVLDIGTRLSSEGDELLHARSAIVAASRAAQLAQPVDTVYPDFKDDSGLKRESKRARSLGYGGKMIIHPGQITTVHQIFTPSPEEVAQARRILQAFLEAERKGLAAVNLDGKMLDYPVMRQARQLLEKAGERVGNQ